MARTFVSWDVTEEDALSGYARIIDHHQEVKAVKKERGSGAKNSNGASSSKPASHTGPVTEDEIRAVLLHEAPVTAQDLVAKFKSRLRTREDKDAFVGILRKISKLQKTNGPSYVVLKDK